MKSNGQSNGKVQALIDSAAPDITAAPVGKRARILIVEDEPAMVAGLRDNFEYEGYEVISAGDGVQGLERALSENPDLVVLDVMMPFMDGFEVLRTLKANPATAEIPVIMLTAKAQDADVFRGWQSGVDCYLTKPFNPMELLTFVKRIFDSQSGGGDEKRIKI